MKKTKELTFHADRLTVPMAFRIESCRTRRMNAILAKSDNVNDFTMERKCNSRRTYFVDKDTMRR